MHIKIKFHQYIKESYNRKDYLSWKRKNVTLRGISNESGVNNGGSMLGKGLYTAPLSNKNLAKQYGSVKFIFNAIPKKPKIFNTLNEWEIWFQNKLVYKYSLAAGKEYPDIRDFNANTTIEDEVQKLGYDGIIIKGREMVNYKPKDILYFSNEGLLEQYYDLVISKEINESIVNETTAYHGSRYDFDSFDDGCIGTGEGASGWGYGLYFTEDINDAKEYARKLETEDGEARLYKVQIPHKSKFYDLDLHNDEQSAYIKKCLKNIPDSYKKRILKHYKDDYDFMDINGKSLYDTMVMEFEDEYDASKLLYKWGMLGTTHTQFRYRNYVVFRDEDIKVIKKTKPRL